MSHDVVVCGAGPAGSVVAGRLAAAGLRVALVGGPARQGWEGLSSRSRALLSEEGIDAEGEIIAGPFERRGAWANGRSVEGAEWLVERAALAAAMNTHARGQGADYRADTVTKTARAGDRWQVLLRSGETLVAPMVVDARGRGARSRGLPRDGASSTRSLNERRRGPVLLAMGQAFRRAAGPWATGIGVTDTGWCWWAEQGESLWVQSIGRPQGVHPTAWVATAAAQIPALARALETAHPVGDSVARAAHAQRCDAGDAAGAPMLWRAGDAAMALDPLSGQGVYEALRGARCVASAIQSVVRGGDARLAQRGVDERYQAAWLRGVAAAAGFYHENAARGRFWIDTARGYEALLAQPVSAINELRERGPSPPQVLPRMSSGG